MPRPEARRTADHFKRIDWPALEARALDLVRAQLTEQADGPEKLERVVDALIEHLDRAIRPPQPLAELVSDVLLRTVLRPMLRGLAQSAYERVMEDEVQREARAAKRRAKRA